MTTQEFNAFLQAQELKWLHNQEPVVSCNDEYGDFWFGSGWNALTAELITDLIALGWDRQVAQVKEKFGGGRFYIGAGTREIHDRIMQWGRGTFETCEFCGTKEGVTTSGNWLKTLCTSCREILHQKSNQ